MNKKVEVIQQAISLLSESIDHDLLKFEPKGETIIEFSFGLFVERTFRSLKAIASLIRLKDEDLENAIGLISRSILTDFFQVFFLVELSQSKIEISNHLKTIYKDSEKQINNLIELLKNHPHYPSEMIVKAKEINTERARFLGAEEKFKRSYGTAKLVKEISESANVDPRYKRFPIQGFDIWKLLSQYEHFGHFYFYMSKSVQEGVI